PPEVPHQDVGRGVVGVAAGTDGEVLAAEAAARVVVGIPAVLRVTRVITEDVRGADPAGGDLLRFRHQQRRLVGAGRVKALAGVDGEAGPPGPTEFLEAGADASAAPRHDRGQV